MEFGHYPVRFLKILNINGLELLFTGNGGTLRAFSMELPFTLIFSREIFTSNYIHGAEVSSSGGKICVFGQRCFRILRVDSGPDGTLNIDHDSSVVTAGDWIWAATWIGDSKLLLLLGHNQVRLVSTTALLSPCQTVQCDECCLLYSGILIFNEDDTKNDSWSPCVISGTVFNEILVWLPFGSTKVIHRLKGHQGVIFDIAYDSVHSHCLFSASDDRSCRVWKLTLQGESKLIPGTPPTQEQWLNGHFEPSHVLYGHEARVWRMVPMVDRFASVGEDSTVCLWDTKEGTLVKKWKCNRGGIRTASFAASSRLLFCGSDSGSIFSINLPRDGDDGSADVCAKNCTITMSPQSDEEVTAVYYTNEAAMDGPVDRMTVTNRGTVALSRDNERLHLLAEDNALRYSTGDKANNNVVIGGLDGHIHLFHFMDGVQHRSFQLVEGKIFSAHFIGRQAQWLLLCSADGIMSAWSISEIGHRPSLLSKFQLPPGKQRWLECGVICTSTRSPMDYLVVGDRNGSIYFYDFSAEGPDEIKQPIQSFPKIHGNKEVTDLMVDGETDVGGELHSIGRDGCWRRWRYESRKWRIIACEKLYNHFEWPSRFVRRDGGLMIAGFRSNKFVLYDAGNRQYLCEIECGGGHRSYDFQLFDTSSGSSFIRLLFTKKGRACEFVQEVDSIYNIEPALHLRRITDVTVIPPSQTVETYIIATCSEDTTVALWTLREGSLQLVQRLQGHISSVHCLNVSEKWLISGGGRSEICWWSPVDVMGNQYRLTYRNKSDDDDVRCLGVQAFIHDGTEYFVAVYSDGHVSFFAILSSSRSHSRPVEIAQLHSSCCLTRIRSLNYERSDHWPILFIAGTNGKLYIINSSFLSPIVESYHKQKSQESSPLNSDGENSCGEAGDDDNDLSIYTRSMKNRARRREVMRMKKREEKYGGMFVGQLEEYAASIAVENAGLTALDVKWMRKDEYIAMCSLGSESGSLLVLLIHEPPSAQRVQFVSKSHFSFCHTSTVTGLTYIDSDYLISNSIDQRVSLWKYVITGDEVEIISRAEKISHVADPANIVFMPKGDGHHRALVCGAGLQLMEIEMDDGQ